jgi:hypothetical protein
MQRFFFISIILLILLSISPVIAPSQININTADGLSIDYPKFEQIEIGTNYNLSIDIFNISNGMPIINAGCNIHIHNQTGGEVVKDSIDYISGSEYRAYLTLSSEQIGEYAYHINCNNTDLGGFASGTIHITGNGEPPAKDNLQIFIYLFFGFTIVALLTTLILTLAKLALADETLYGVITTWSVYLMLIFSNHLGSSYLLDPFVMSITNNLLGAFAFTHGVLPLVSLIITMFIKSTKKKKNLSVKELTGGNLHKYG